MATLLSHWNVGPLLLSMLYKSFDVERVGKGDEMSEQFGFTTVPVNLKVRLHRRSNASVQAPSS